MKNKTKYETETEILPHIEEWIEREIKESLLNRIIIYNDNVNTFEHVIYCLQKYCGHDMLQAGQCALIIHNNGKCDVKRGSYSKLRPMCEALLDQGITATIE